MSKRIEHRTNRRCLHKVRGVKKKYITENNKKRRWTETHVILKLPVSASPNNVGLNEQLNFHFSLSCTGEGNGNPLQCSCLENPRDGGAWSAAVYGVAQSQTQLKQLNSSSSSRVVTVEVSGRVVQLKSSPLSIIGLYDLFAV